MFKSINKYESKIGIKFRTPCLEEQRALKYTT